MNKDHPLSRALDRVRKKMADEWDMSQVMPISDLISAKFKDLCIEGKNWHGDNRSIFGAMLDLFKEIEDLQEQIRDMEEREGDDG